jgi:hypothetical protein
VSALGIGASQGNTLVRNGFQGLIRGQLPVPMGVAFLEPYVFGGMGWDHYSFTNNLPVNASVTANDNVLTVPAGGGVSVGYRGFIFDARFTYRPTFFDSLFGDASLTNWNANGSLGYEF